MSDVDSRRIQQEIHRTISSAPSTRFGDAINRYLGAVGHRPGEAVLPSRHTALRTAGKILVGVDDTTASYAAVDHAAIEADLHGWSLLLFHVQHPAGLHPASRDDGARLLERLTERVHSHTSTVVVTSRLAVGSPSALLLMNARDAGLVVVGHRHGAAGAAFGLSVGDRIAEQHHGVVLVARIPAWPPGPDFGRRPIVVGVDTAHGHTPAVDFALREASVRGCDVVVLHAGRNKVPAEHAETVDGVVVHHRTVAADPVTALIEHSGRAAALVVGRRVPGRAVSLLGSVSRAMVQRAYCPVFLVG